MIQNLAGAVKRFPFTRFLIITALALGLLLLGYFLRGYFPIGWIEQFQTGFLTLPSWVAQTPLVEATPIEFPSAVPGINGSDEAGIVPTIPATPEASPSPDITGLPGIVTVITLTPTGAANLTDPGTSRTEQAPLTQGQATASVETAFPPASPTPLPSEILQPTGTLGPATAVPTIASESPAQIVKIKTDIQDLYRILGATRVLMATFWQGQPTAEELTAMQAQLTVIMQRMDKLDAQLQSAQAGAETFGMNARVSPAQVRELLILMREALVILQSVLANSAPDSVILGQALLEQLQGMMEQVQGLVAPDGDDAQAEGALAGPTPTVTPSPTATQIPAVTSTPAAPTGDPLSRLQMMLRQMEEILHQMQTVLQQMQDQSGTGLTTP